MCNCTHNNVTQRIPSFYTQCVVLHTVCNLTNFMYVLFFPKPSVLLHSVCSFTLSVQFYTQCVVLHSVCSFTLKVQFYTQCVVLHSGGTGFLQSQITFNLTINRWHFIGLPNKLTPPSRSSRRKSLAFPSSHDLHVYDLLGPINHNLRYFVAKSVCRNLRVLRCKIFCPKFLSV